MKQNHKLRSNRAGAILELASISALLVIVAMFCADVLILAIGSGLNERACRDAARLAAQSTNYSDSLQLAQTAVKAHRGDGYFVSNPVVDTATFQYNDFGGHPPVDTSPFVSVSTSCQIRIPAPIFLLGLDWGNNGTMQFRKTYVFPIITTQAPS